MATIKQGTRVLLHASRCTPITRARCSRIPAVRVVPLRQYSAAVASAAEAPSATSTEPPPLPPPPPTTTTTTDATSRPSNEPAAPQHRIRAGLILTRAPLLTREPTPFESAYFFYQKRLGARLTLPFSRRAWFREGTPPEMDFALKTRDRGGGPSRELGFVAPSEVADDGDGAAAEATFGRGGGGSSTAVRAFTGRSSRSWDDELLVGDQTSKPETLIDGLLHDSVQRISEDAEEIAEEKLVPAERPLPRMSEADEKGDLKALHRCMDRTLYLVVKGKDGKWTFPADEVSPTEALHLTARRVLKESAGVNMNTWIVGRVPVAHHVKKPVLEEDGAVAEQGEKTFYLKGRIMAGQADLAENKFGLQDFKWLTKEELQGELEPEYFHSLRNMMADR